jgi:hypothetical protein
LCSVRQEPPAFTAHASLAAVVIRVHFPGAVNGRHVQPFTIKPPLHELRETVYQSCESLIVQLNDEWREAREPALSNGLPIFTREVSERQRDDAARAFPLTAKPKITLVVQPFLTLPSDRPPCCSPRTSTRSTLQSMRRGGDPTRRSITMSAIQVRGAA